MTLPTDWLERSAKDAAKGVKKTEPKYACDTCRDEGVVEDHVCYGGAPISKYFACPDCRPEAYGCSFDSYDDVLVYLDGLGLFPEKNPWSET